MAGSIKPSFFTTGPKEDLVVVDVYKPVEALNKPAPQAPAEDVQKKTETSVRNKPTDAKNAAAKAVEAMKNATATKLTSGAVKQAASEAAVKSATDELANYLGGTSNPRDSLGESVTDDLLGNMGIKKDTLKQQAIEIGASGIAGSGVLGEKRSDGLMRFVEKGGTEEISSIVKNGDLDTAQGVQSLLGAIGSSKTIEVLNLDAQFAVLQGVMDKANQLGLINVIDTVLDKVRDKKDQRRFILDNVFSFFTNGDLLSINRAIDILGAGGVIARVPDAINLLLRYYRYPSRVQSAEERKEALRKQYDLLVGTLERLDDRWYEAEWNGETLINLEPYHGASRDAVTVLERNPTHYRRCVRAKQFGVRSIKQYCATQYPFLELAEKQ